MNDVALKALREMAQVSKEYTMRPTPEGYEVRLCGMLIGVTKTPAGAVELARALG